jgi:Flp pilus assembly protein TadD
MAEIDARGAMPNPARSVGVIAALSACLMLGACAQVGGDGAGLLSALAPETAQPAAAQLPSDPQQATEYWGKEYEKDPRNLDAALAYAQNLRVTGKKREAMAVLQQASIIHGSDKKLAADYGRLALELDQIGVAKKLLAIADDPTNPDWRIVMARGTALAKEGSYREAITFYERAQALKPGHPSVLNNLALAYTMSGEPERGEQLLRQASASGNENSKVRQNLALVLGLQGKYDEATKIASVDLEAVQAQANTAFLKKMVKADPKPMTPQAPAPDAWAPAVVASKGSDRSQASASVAAAVPVARATPSAAPVLRASKVETGFGDNTGNGKAASLFDAE